MTGGLETGYIIIADEGPAHHTTFPALGGAWEGGLGITFCGLRYRPGLWWGRVSTEKPEARICQNCLKSIAYKVHFPEQARANEAGR